MVAATKSSESSSNINLWPMNAPRVRIILVVLLRDCFADVFINIYDYFSGAGLQAELRRV